MLEKFIISGITMVCVDYIYLSSIQNMFNKMIKRIQNKDIKMKYSGAILCYIFLVLGLNYFILQNNKFNYKEKLIGSFILGIVIYGVYETTNYALINNWDFNLVLIDTIWGGILFLLTTIITINIFNYIRLK